MMSHASSTLRPSIFGFAALALTVAGWLWFVVCFSARAGGWWNSLSLFVVVYGIALVLSVRGIQSIVGVLALLSIPSLGIVCILAFGR
jgi:hypothetical protein